MTCARCKQPPTDHPNGDCPDGQGTFEFAVNPAVVDWLKANPDVPSDQLAERWIAHLRKKG